MSEAKPMWYARSWNGATRYHRDGPGGYNLRHIMEPGPGGKPARRRWTLYAKASRIWDVQPACTVGAAIDAAEAWINGR